MPMPTTIEMNITENSERWPMTSVATPMAQACESASTTSMMSGRPRRRNARSSSASVSANARTVARSLSRKAAVISSFASAGLPVTPTSTSGNSSLSEAITRRAPSIAARSAVKLARSTSGSARMNSSFSSPERKYPALGDSCPRAKRPPQGER